MIYLELKGSRALFSRHEIKAERISYEVPTPSAMLGILKSIYWKPEMDYEIEEIHVLKKQEYELVMKNGQSLAPDGSSLEKSFSKEKLPYVMQSDSSPMSQNILVNVHYVVSFRIICTGKDDSTQEKHIAIFQRRAEKGQCYRTPCLGMQEFPCEFRLIKKEEIPKSEIRGEKKLGIMLHHIDYSEKIPKPVFYKPIMRNGVINTNESYDGREGWLFEELCNFYDDNCKTLNLPMIGYSNEKVTYRAVISQNSELISLEPICVSEKGKIVPVIMNVPEAVKGRTSGIKACFAYDNASYVFGFDSKNGEQKRLAFMQKIRDVLKDGVEETDILLKFLDGFSVGKYHDKFARYISDKGVVSLQGNIVFQIDGEEHFIHEIKEVKRKWMEYYRDNLTERYGVCGVSGKYKKVTDMHPAIKGITGGSAFTKLISVNSANTAFNSYGWTGLENSSFGVEEAHKYAVSLNWLLSDYSHRVSVGQSTFVYWTERNEPEVLSLIKYMILGFSGERPEVEITKSETEMLYILELKANSSRLIVVGFNKFQLGNSKEVINYCLKASGILKNGNIKHDWDYISEQRGGDGMNEEKIGYKLGELFALLEKAQRDAVKSTRETKTIVDKYIYKASATPALIFPRLLENSVHHTNKVNYGMRQKISEKMDELRNYEIPFPRKLDEEQRCLFHMGYYSCNNKIYEEIAERAEKKKSKEKENKADEQN